jgi:hypothetical protein
MIFKLVSKLSMCMSRPLVAETYKQAMLQSLADHCTAVESYSQLLVVDDRLSETLHMI